MALKIMNSKKKLHVLNAAARQAKADKDAANIKYSKKNVQKKIDLKTKGLHQAAIAKEL
jgi:hypothetical protein